MKKQILMSLVLLLTVVVAGASNETFGQQELRAEIPFSFNVGNTTLPAGQYTIKVVNPSSDRRVLSIRRSDGRFSAMVHALDISAQAQDDASLIFKRYGDRYVFSAARMAGTPNSFAALKSKTESRLQREAHKMGRQPAVIALNVK